MAALSRSGPEEGELRLRPRLAFAPAAVARLVEGLAGAHRRAHELGARLAARRESLLWCFFGGGGGMGRGEGGVLGSPLGAWGPVLGVIWMPG